MKSVEKPHTRPSRIAHTTRSQLGRVAGPTFRRPSRSTRNASGSRRAVNCVISAGVDLNLYPAHNRHSNVKKHPNGRTHPAYLNTSCSSLSSLSPSRAQLSGALPLSLLRSRSPSEAYRYGSLKKRSLWRIIPRDHISDLESTCCKSPVSGEGNDSGEVYSRLRRGVWICRWKEKRMMTYVPVFPERARELCIMSREVPKSDNMARGLFRIRNISGWLI